MNMLRQQWKRLGEWFCAALGWIDNHAAVCLSIPSLYLLLFYPPLWKPLNVLPSTFLPAAVRWQQRAARDRYLGFGNRLRFGLLFAATAVIAIFWTIRRGAWRTVGLPVLTVLTTGLVVFGATMVCVYYMDRYTAPLEIAALVSLSLIAGELWGTAGPPIEPAAEPIREAVSRN